MVLFMKWIGMVHVRPMEGSAALSSGAKGAYGNVVAIADSEIEYKEIVRIYLKYDGLEVIEFSDIGTEADYHSQGKLSDYLSYLLGNLSSDHFVQLHTFYNYGLEDS
jgi:hypothetical protein